MRQASAVIATVFISLFLAGCSTGQNSVAQLQPSSTPTEPTSLQTQPGDTAPVDGAAVEQSIDTAAEDENDVSPEELHRRELIARGAL